MLTSEACLLLCIVIIRTLDKIMQRLRTLLCVCFNYKHLLFSPVVSIFFVFNLGYNAISRRVS